MALQDDIVGELKRAPALARAWVAPNVTAFLASGQPRVWVLALAIGIGVGLAAIAFREAIAAVQWLWLGTRSEKMLATARSLPWYWILACPVVGGVVVGQILRLISTRRTGGVADVIEARTKSGRHLRLRDGLLSALATAISLGAGASAGREGPVVHLGATLATALAHWQRLPGWASRTLLGAGVASAVSASFNAPIAGVLFAHEVILGHYAPRAFAPIVIASTGGAIASRLWFGEAAAFAVPRYQLTSYWEFPAFALLGLTCGLVAIAFQFALVGSDYMLRKVTMPLWLMPVAGGAVVGAIAVFFPEIIGVGYDATDLALWNRLPLSLMLALIVVKAAATAITLASRFGGGVFSPSLYLGAMTGGAFGLIAGPVFPDMASSEGLYAILGMGAVAGAVLGAPISTTVIVFELTGGYTLSIALLMTVAIAHAATQAIHGHSYFHWQLAMRGLFVQDGSHRTLARDGTVADFLDPLQPGEDDATPENLRPAALRAGDSLDVALRAFDTSGQGRLPVVDASGTRMIGWASQVRALAFFNKALIDASVEEHR